MSSIWSNIKNIRADFQHLKYVRMWALLSLVAAALTLFCLYQSLEIWNHKGGGEFGFFIVAVVTIPMFHLFLIVFAPQLRYLHFMRGIIQPSLLAFITILVGYIPTMLVVDEASMKKSRAYWILGVILSTNLSFFSIQMICLPSFDFMFMHTGLSSLSIVVFHITEDEKLMWFWRIFVVILCGLALIGYHWITHPISDQINSENPYNEANENKIDEVMKKIKGVFLKKFTKYWLIMNSAYGFLFSLVMFLLILASIRVNQVIRERAH